MSGDNANIPPMQPAGDPLAELLAAERPRDPAPAPNLQELIDKEGKGGASAVFNPDIHEVDGNGAPIKNLNGSFRLKRGRGSPKHRASLAGGPVDAASMQLNVDEIEPPAPTMPYGQAEAERDAVLAVGTLTGSLQGFFGPKWKPEAEEFQMMRDELAAYCLQHGGLGIPPWLGVAMAFGMYAGRRIELPGGLSAKLLGKAPEDQPAEVEREHPPTAPIEQKPANDARPRPVTAGASPTAASSRPPVRTAA